jgi:hypothetical protein
MIRALLTASFCLTVLPALADETTHVSYKTSAGSAKYVQQLNVDVGDIPGHIVRVFDLSRNHRENSPVINGVKMMEETARGLTDIINGNGSTVVYTVYTMENGDKFFSRATQVSTGAPDGTITAVGTGPITGGTGHLENIHGIVKFAVKFNVTSGFNEGTTDIGYSIDK